MITIKTLRDARSAINFLSGQRNMILNELLNTSGYEREKEIWNGFNNHSRGLVKLKLRKFVKRRLCSDPIIAKMQEAVRLFIEEFCFNCGLISEEERKRNEQLIEHAREYAMITISEYN
jgi:hypothetical protein